MFLGHVYKLSTSLYWDAFSNNFKFYHQNNLSDFLKFSNVYLLFMKERNINQTAVSLNERFNDASNPVTLCVLNIT